MECLFLGLLLLLSLLPLFVKFPVPTQYGGNLRDLSSQLFLFFFFACPGLLIATQIRDNRVIAEGFIPVPFSWR